MSPKGAQTFALIYTLYLEGGEFWFMDYPPLMEELSHWRNADFTLRWAESQTNSAEQAEFTRISDLSQTERECLARKVCFWTGTVHDPGFTVLQELIWNTDSRSVGVYWDVHGTSFQIMARRKQVSQLEWETL